jgi:hypothetical protein
MLNMKPATEKQKSRVDKKVREVDAVSKGAAATQQPNVFSNLTHTLNFVGPG